MMTFDVQRSARLLVNPAEKHIGYGHDQFGKGSWQVMVLTFIHSKPVGWTLFVLLILDILIIFVGLFLEGYYPSCDYIIRDAVCSSDDDMNNIAQCDEEKYPLIEVITGTLEILSFGILFLFALENCVLLAILGSRNFFGHPMYCLDFGIVFISAGFEIFSMFIDDEVLSDFVQFIIIGRLWRFVSLSYDLISMQKEHDDETNESLQERISELEQLLLATNNNINKTTTNDQQTSDHENTADTNYHRLT